MDTTTSTVAATDLPPFPPVANTLLGLAGKQDASIGEVTEVLATDAAISAELLRVANAAFVGVRGEVESVVQAAAILGLKRISSLAATVALRSYVGQFWQTDTVRRCWLHNLATALIAEGMARKIALDPDASYTAGLLHDVGRLSLIVKHRGAYIRLLNLPAEPGDGRLAERELFGIDHTEAGALVLAQLQLPQLFRDIAMHHHDPGAATNADVAGVVHVGCVLATAIGFGVHERPAHASNEVDSEEIVRTLQTLPAAYHDTLVQEYESLLTMVRDLIEAYRRAIK